MFRPNLTGSIRTRIGYDVHGRPKLSQPRPVRFSQAEFGRDIMRTPDGAASAGAAGQGTAADSVILIDRKAKIDIEDVFTFDGQDYRVMAVYPRRDITGFVDHYEAALELFEG
jgi:hypothetical protein